MYSNFSLFQAINHEPWKVQQTQNIPTLPGFVLSKSSSCVIVVIINLFGASLSGSSLNISLENRLQLIMTINATPKPRRTCTRFLLKCIFNTRRKNDDTDTDGTTSQNMYLTEYVYYKSIQFCTLTRRSTMPAHNPPKNKSLG